MKAHMRIAVLGLAVIVGLSALSAILANTPPAGQPAEVRLPAPDTRGGMSLTDALSKRRSVRTFADKPLSTQQVAQLCWAAQGITQEERGLRTAPSALAQYPIGLFVVDEGGIHEYLPKSHTLRLLDANKGLPALRATAGQPPVASAPVCMILTMDVKRMEARCGDKAERYCLLEAGHVAQNVLLQATALGLASVPVGGLDEGKIGTAMGLPPQLRPVYLLPIGYSAEPHGAAHRPVQAGGDPVAHDRQR